MIPNKSSFKFQELTPITGVKPYVIRYWETEFMEISPVTSDSGQKIYARKDLEAILKIKKLLFEEKLSIPEAKNRMSRPEIEAPIKVETKLSPKVSPHILDDLQAALELIKEVKLRRNW